MPEIVRLNSRCNYYDAGSVYSQESYDQDRDPFRQTNFNTTTKPLSNQELNNATDCGVTRYQLKGILSNFCANYLPLPLAHG